MVKPRRKISKQRAIKLSKERKKRQEIYSNPALDLSDSEDQYDGAEHDEEDIRHDECELSCNDPVCTNYSIESLEDFLLPSHPVLVRTFFYKTAPITRTLFEGQVVDKFNEPYTGIKMYPVNRECCIIGLRFFDDLLRIARDNVIIVDGMNYMAILFRSNLPRAYNYSLEGARLLPLLTESASFTKPLGQLMQGYSPIMDADTFNTWDKLIS